MQSRLNFNELPYEIIWGIFNDLPFDCVLATLSFVDKNLYQMITSYKSQYFEKILLQAVSDRVRASFLLNSLKPIVENKLFIAKHEKPGELNGQHLNMIYQVLTSQDVTQLEFKQEDIDTINEIISGKIKNDLKQSSLWENLLISLELWFMARLKNQSQEREKNISDLIEENENVFFNLSGLDLSGYNFNGFSLLGCYTTGCLFEGAELGELFTSFMELRDSEINSQDLFIRPEFPDFEFSLYFDTRIINSSIVLYIWRQLNFFKDIHEDEKQFSLLLLSYIKKNPHISFPDLKEFFTLKYKQDNHSKFISSFNIMFKKFSYILRLHTENEEIDLKDNAFNNKFLWSNFFHEWALRFNLQDIKASFVWVDRLLKINPASDACADMNRMSCYIRDCSIISPKGLKFKIDVLKGLIDIVSSKELYDIINNKIKFILNDIFQVHLNDEEIWINLQSLFSTIQFKIKFMIQKKELAEARKFLNSIFSYDLTKTVFLTNSELEKAYFSLEYQIYLQCVDLDKRKIIFDLGHQSQKNDVAFKITGERYIFTYMYPHLILYLANDCNNLKAAIEYYQAMTEFNSMRITDGDEIIFRGIYMTLIGGMRDYLAQSIPQISQGERLNFIVTSPKLYPKLNQETVTLSFNTSMRFSFFHFQATIAEQDNCEKRNEAQNGM